MSAINLVATTKEFRLADDSGYQFRVVASHDPEWGWEASVTVTSGGFTTDEAALLALRNGVEKLLGMLPSPKEPE